MSCISRTKISTILNKNYTEMRKERDIRGNDYWMLQCPSHLFFLFYKVLWKWPLQRTLQSPQTISFSWQTLSTKHSLSALWGRAGAICVLWAEGSATSTQEYDNIRMHHRDNILSKRYRITKCQSKMDNPEKLATQGTQDDEKQSKNTTQYALDTTICNQTQITLINHEPFHK